MTTWRQWLERNPAGQGKIYHYDFDIDLDEELGEPPRETHRENLSSVQSDREDLSSKRCLSLDAAKKAERENLPDLLGELEVIRTTALMRLSTPVATPDQHDTLLDIDTAAERLGVSRDYVYRNSKQFPFTRRMGRKLVFSSLGIDQYIKKRAR